MKSVLVTGASGYIGQHVVRALKERGARVIGVDRRRRAGDLSDSFVEADLLDPAFSLADVLTEVPDVCLHLAWRNGFDHANTSHMLDLSAHYRFVLQVIEMGVGQVAGMGTMHEVGYWEGAIDEATPCNPQSLYGISKDALRRSLMLAAEKAGIKAQWLRGFYIYGDDSSSRSIFGKLLRADAAGEKRFPFTSGKNKYDFIDVGELARQISACVLQDEVLGTISCCSGTPRSLADQVEEFIASHGLNIALDYGAYPDRPYDSPGVWGDASKIHAALVAAGEVR
ncbi:NAD-dependent epimerase/dehydratase family protein [Collinsella vaginalis]|uniref:NAD-dependent epimerase/dehydratase family protein n=1 Tax=Collinsella vaginalis TaxID=1870987 RepID=UPI000A26F9E0|nr:NAD(P)-dependent oxidoreductase [Collinsella vaginalis]